MAAASAHPVGIGHAIDVEAMYKSQDSPAGRGLASRKENEVREDRTQGQMLSHAPATQHSETLQDVGWPQDGLNSSQRTDHIQTRIEVVILHARQLEGARNNVFHLRFDLKWHRDQLRRSHDFAAQSQQRFVEHTDLMAAGDDFVSSRDELYARYGNVRADWLSFQNMSRKVQDLEDGLSAAEYDTSQLEVKLQQSLQHLSQALAQVPPDERLTNETAIASHPIGASTEFRARPAALELSTVTSDTPSLLEEYYDKAGDVKIMQDRELEFERDYAIERADRIFREDQGQVLSVSEAEFEARASSERAAARLAIDLALNARDEVLEVCRARGIDPFLRDTGSLSAQKSPMELPGFSVDSASEISSPIVRYLTTPLTTCISNDTNGNPADGGGATPSHQSSGKGVVSQWIDSVGAHPALEPISPSTLLDRSLSLWSTTSTAKPRGFRRIRSTEDISGSSRSSSWDAEFAYGANTYTTDPMLTDRYERRHSVPHIGPLPSMSGFHAGINGGSFHDGRAVC